MTNYSLGRYKIILCKKIQNFAYDYYKFFLIKNYLENSTLDE